MGTAASTRPARRSGAAPLLSLIVCNRGSPDSRAALDRTAEGGCPDVSSADWQGYFDRLLEQGRAARAQHAGATYWVAAERAQTFSLLFPDAKFERTGSRDSRRLCRPPTMLCWPWSPAGCRTWARPRLRSWADCLGFPLLKLKRLCCGWKPPALSCADNLPTLTRGRSRPRHTATELEWCERRLLARIHRLTVATLRKQIEPVTAAQFMRWLLRWQHVAPGAQVQGERATLEVLRQLQGFEIPANAWERQILARRIANYDPKWLDQLCLTGAVGWGRLSPHPATLEDTAAGKRRVIPTSVAPITFFVREEADWMTPHRPDSQSSPRRAV